MEGHLSTFEINRNVCLKSLLLVGELMRRGASKVGGEVRELVEKMSEHKISEEVKGLGGILL